MKTASRISVAVAACTIELDPTRLNELQLAPAGLFRARDGRPAGLPGWLLDGSNGPAVALQASLRATPYVIDYEHQTLAAAQNGQPSPAAGWFHKLEWREGQGLYATDVTWTERATAMIAAKEYRFLSPVFSYDAKTGAVQRIEMAALTNNPALDGLAEIELRAAAKYTAETETEDDTMNPILLALLTMLGLKEDATEASATAALKALQDQVAAKDTEIAALKTQAPDPAKFVPIEAVTKLQEQVAALTAADQARAVDELVRGALDSGRLLPAMEEWARDLGKTNVAALKSYIEKAQPIAALVGTQTGGRAPAGADATVVGDADLAVCKQLGISVDEYQKANGLQAA